MKTLFMIVMLTAFAAAQDAKMMLVEPVDATELKTAWKVYQEEARKAELALENARKKWDTAKLGVARKYTLLPDNKTVLKGWEKIEFSVDFRIIVPSERTYYSSSVPNWTGITTASGTGTVLANGTDGLRWVEVTPPAKGKQ